MEKQQIASVYNTEKVLTLNEYYPFSITFSWKEKNIRVQLNNGEDVLKIAAIFSNLLSENNIPHTFSEL